MKIKNIVILGAGGTAFTVIDIIKAINRKEQQWTILGYLDDNEDLIGKEIMGIKVLGNIHYSENLRDVYFVSSIGSAYDTQLRKKARQKVLFPDECFATLIHPNTTISESARIEPGTIIYSNVCVGAVTYIGHDVVLMYHTAVGHESTIGKHSVLSYNVLIPSDVHVGECCYIGVGAAFRHQLDIGDNCLIGMGTQVVKSVPSNTKYVNKIENIFTPL